MTTMYYFYSIGSLTDACCKENVNNNKKKIFNTYIDVYF